ncbi:dynein heavy chain domain-containing protein 1-like [Pecten maximus]|uniref:dynein heavy chain domain-containing protein 1-like n=1 Tax=Pecten maximus TaxID=6579 RepID=UPI00145904E1|nr:dynein heavy chain domain-containing protein 1-like [Pecten maximus]
MAAKLEQSPEQTSSLPLLRDGQTSLVAPSQASPAPSPRHRAALWAQEVRQRLKRGDNLEEDVRTLKKELIAVFITALQQDSRSAWVFLHEVLCLLEPLKESLDFPEIKPEIVHYIERVLHHVTLHKERLFDLQISESLCKVFPKEVGKVNHYGTRPSNNYGAPVIKLSSVSPQKSSHTPRHGMLLPDNTNPYAPVLPREDEPMLFAKPLTIGDLRSSIAGVAMEMAARESIWSHHFGTVTTALATDIIDPPDQTKPDLQVSMTNRQTPRSSVSSLSGSQKDSKTPRIQEEKVIDMTGREAVEYFAKLHHIGKIQSIYFNKVENRHYRPYDLRSVAKNKADSEHYVFSTFGVLHVYPDQPSESLSLAEWQREAVLWTAVSSIPFFKQFLIRKMFCKWRYNKRYLDFLRRQDNLTANLLPAVPAFGAAILQVSRLLKELITVKFLPFDVDKTYQLADFENYVNYKNIQAEKFLEKFFRYCKMVMDVTAEESFKKLKYCEDQVKKKTVFSKDSLHMQRVKKENRAENLRKARSETGRLGNFVKLVDQVIVEHMFYICKNQVISFVDQVLKIGDEAPRDGFFKANLILTKQDVLGLSPPSDRFIKVLASTLKGIPTVLTCNAIPIDGSVPPDQDILGDDTESSAPTKSDAAKSVENVRIAERRKSTAKSSLKQDSHYNLGDRDKAMSSQATPAGETTAGETTTGEATDVESQVGMSKSVLGDDGVMLPDLPRQGTVTKEQDLMGVATPDLVVRADERRLVVMGEGFMGQYDPLSRANLEDKLDKDMEYQQALQEHSKIICAGLEEIDQYCERAAWIHPIHIFCKKWNDKSLKEFKGMAAYTIEQRLTELRQWSERIRNFDKSFSTENNLFYIDCMAIHEVLLPRLNYIYQEVVTFVAEEAKTLATSFCEEMEEVLQNMKDKRASVDAFARFAKNFNIYKKNAPQYQQRMEYIKSLFEVIRMGYRQLSPEEEKIEENVSAAGEAFMLQMQDASEFVNTQTPLMTKLLEDTFQVDWENFFMFFSLKI